MDDFKQKVISASKWSFITELAPKFIAPLSLVVLARLLSPNDYGVVGAAAIVIAFTQIFSDAGLNLALIQRKENVYETANVVFWSNLALSSLLFLIIFFSADLFATLFKDPRIGNVLRVQSLLLPINAVSAVQSSLIRKELEFKKIFISRISNLVTPFIITIPIAFAGFGYWSLVIGTLAGAILQVFVLWKLNNWKPQLAFDKKIFKSLISFGSWITLEGLLGWFYNWGDSLIIGIYLTTGELGLFRTGTNIIAMIFGISLSYITPVLYPMFSKINDDIEKVASYVLKTNKLISAVSLYIAVILFFYADYIQLIIFGNKWQGVDKVIRLMAFVQGFVWYYGANYEAYRAIGKSKINSIIMIFGLTYYIPTYIFTASQSLEMFLYGRVAIILIGQIIHLTFLYRIFRITPIRWISNFSNIFLLILITSIQFYLVRSFVNDFIWVSVLGSIISIEYFFLLIKRDDFIKNILLELLKNIQGSKILIKRIK